MNIDPKCLENGKKNIRSSFCKCIQLLEGSQPPHEKVQTYDLILSNIDRNILLEKIPQHRDSHIKNIKKTLGWLPNAQNSFYG